MIVLIISISDIIGRRAYILLKLNYVLVATGGLLRFILLFVGLSIVYWQNKDDINVIL